MADYKVKILTKSGQFRDVIVRDFVYSADAERAALSQTGGGQIRSVSPHFDKPKESSMFDENYVHPPRRYDEEWDTSDWYDDDGELNFKGNMVHYCIASALPTVTLFLVHPFAAIFWNIAFSKWWFEWKFWFE
jgi:hypothetical protein